MENNKHTYTQKGLFWVPLEKYVVIMVSVLVFRGELINFQIFLFNLFGLLAMSSYIQSHFYKAVHEGVYLVYYTNANMQDQLCDNYELDFKIDVLDYLMVSCVICSYMVSVMDSHK